ncbi:MAG: hypothetical protein K6E10_02095 [Eubacterium sp.]|nr:hypothetical protein [Eubacterium sp.]
MKKKFLAILMVPVIAFSIMSAPYVRYDMCNGNSSYVKTQMNSVNAASSTCIEIEGDNTNSQDYQYDKWSSPVKANLQQTSDGGFMAVQYVGDRGLIVEYFDSQMHFKSYKEVALDLPVYGGVYLGQNYNYVLTGQNNKAENDSLEVMRITKYDKNWKKLGNCGLFGANTIEPFGAGADMVEEGNYLYVRTCHIMYASADGVNHQANVMFTVNTDNMKITYSGYDVSYKNIGYASHSFNQYVGIDGDLLVGVDHGDAYPRAIALFFCDKGISECAESIDVGEYNLVDLPGNTGANYTGASLAGFEISNQAYLVAGNQDIASEGQGRNLFVAAMDKETEEISYNKITNYKGGNANEITPQFASLGNDRYILLWPYENKVYYTEIDAKGRAKGSIKSMDASLSDCKPIVANGNLTWYVWKDNKVTFYSISTSDLSARESRTAIIGHDYEYGNVVKDGKIDVTCKKCGNVIQKTVPVTFEDKYSVYDANAFYAYYGQLFSPGINQQLWIKMNEVDLPDMDITSGDTSIVEVSLGERHSVLNMKKAGITTLTISPRYNPGAAVTRIMRIGSKGQFDINTCDIDIKVDVSQGASSLEGLEPEVTVKYGDIMLDPMYDYSLDYSASADGKTMYITLSGKGLFADTRYMDDITLEEALSGTEISHKGSGDSPVHKNEWVNGKWYDANGQNTYAGILSWKCNSTGWWVEDTSGWYPTSSWQKIDNIWYYFKADGYMASSEYYDGYWFNSDGSWDPAYKLSWKCNSTGWWVEDISGWWPASRWLKINGYWYYFDASGYMVSNQYVDGYWIGSDGVCY